MNLPNVERAEVAEAKIRSYLLNPAHPDGEAKARFFAALGFTREAWDVLATALRGQALRSPVAKCLESVHGTKYVIDGPIETPSGQSPFVRPVWIVDAGQDVPRLVTAYPCQEGE
jgi:hypothetical protein